jgi:transposase
MAKSYVSTDRDQPFLLPPDVRDWLPVQHLVWMVLEVIDGLDTTALHALHPNQGAGRKAYDPDMLLGLLVYGYCRGVRSSREIERLCEVDVAFRVLSANQIPDHSTLARFRQGSAPVMEALFGKVLELCAEAGMVKVGVVAVDGTKIEASASKGANRSRSQLEELARKILEEAEEVDRREDELYGEGRGDELPPQLADPGTRREAIRRALEKLETREEEIAAAEQGRLGFKQAVVRREEEREAARVVRRVEAVAAGKKPRGPVPSPEGHRDLRRARAALAQAQEKAESVTVQRQQQLRVNTTDPDSRMMKSRERFIQGYNAQAAATEEGVVLACGVTQEGHDHHQAQPMMAEVEENCQRIGAEVGTILFDAGYANEANLQAVGPDRLIATGNARRLRQRMTEEGARTGPPPPDAGPIEAMEHRLLSEEGAALYRKRGSSIEPVFGNIKQRGFYRFMRRGLEAVNSEWQLICATHNLLKLHRRAAATA